MFAFYLYMLNFLDLIVGHFDIFSNFVPRIELSRPCFSRGH